MMIEKRYKVFDNGNDDYIMDMEYALGYDDSNVDSNDFLRQALTSEEIVETLNKYCEENEQLKNIVEALKRVNEIENRSHLEYIKAYSETNGELLNEIEQLKCELEDFKKLVYSFENITDLSNWQQDYENKELKE